MKFDISMVKLMENHIKSVPIQIKTTVDDLNGFSELEQHGDQVPAHYWLYMRF